MPDPARAARLAEILARYGVIAAYAFGSRAAEARAWLDGDRVTSARPSSDLDLGVLPARSRALGVRDKVRLAGELEDLFEVGRVDLVVLPEAPPFLAVDVIDGELLASSDGRASDEYELYVLRRAADLLPFRRARTDAILREGAR